MARPAYLEKLHDLLIIQIGRKTSDIDLVRRVSDRSADYARDMHRSTRPLRSDVVCTKIAALSAL
jgi:hypothetical protein